MPNISFLKIFNGIIQTLVSTPCPFRFRMSALQIATDMQRLLTSGLNTTLLRSALNLAVKRQPWPLKRLSLFSTATPMAKNRPNANWLQSRLMSSGRESASGADAKKPSKFKQFYSQYGPLFVVVHLTTVVMWIYGFFLISKQ